GQDLWRWLLAAQRGTQLANALKLLFVGRGIARFWCLGLPLRLCRAASRCWRALHRAINDALLLIQLRSERRSIPQGGQRAPRGLRAGLLQIVAPVRAALRAVVSGLIAQHVADRALEGGVAVHRVVLDQARANAI